MENNQIADLEVVNRTLGATVRKQEQEIKVLREALIKAAKHLRMAGWHGAADAALDAAS